MNDVLPWVILYFGNYVSVLEAVLHLCQHGDGEASAAQARFLTLQTPKKVR